MRIARGTAVATAVIAATAVVLTGLGTVAQAEEAPSPTVATSGPTSAPSTSPAPAATATASPTASPTATPTATPKPTASPSPTATPKPTPKPKPKPKWVYTTRTLVIGKSVQGRTIVARYKGYKKAKRVLVVLGQMHGDEPAGPRVAACIRKHYKPKKGTGVWVIDTMNPDGAARGTRVNARGVDLNRNWPTSGFTSKDRGTKFWGGPHGGSEPETRAVRTFLKQRKPDYIASFHQPFGVIGKHKEDQAWQRRLAKYLGLPLRSVGIGATTPGVNPTLTSWYNKGSLHQYGTATTIELPSAITSTRIHDQIAPGTLKAALVR